MTPSTPIIKNGKEYNEYAVFLSSAPVIRTTTFTTAVNLKLVPMRTDEASGEVELLEDPAYIKTILYSDIRNQADLRTLQAFGAIDNAIQLFINDKGL